MQTTIENNQFVIRLPLIRQPSSSGKMLLIANTAGWSNTNAQFEGKTVRVNVTAGISLTGQAPIVPPAAGRFAQT